MAEEAPEVHGQGSSGDAIGKIQPSSVGSGKGGRYLEGEVIIRNAKRKGAQGPLSVRGCVAGTPVPPQSKGKKDQNKHVEESWE